MSAISGNVPTRRRLYEKVVDLFGADLRSLAAFRIALGLLVLGDIVNRATDLRAHYSDEGVLPRTTLVEELISPARFSFNLINGEPLFQAFLFGVTALAAVGLLVGYRTRLMTVIVWVLIVSIHVRNPLVLSGGDGLLRLLLFWAMFLPLGAIWSVDRALKVSPPRLSTRFISFATAGLLLQIAFMYWFTAILKSGPEWRIDGTALYYALSIDRFPTPIGSYLLQFPELLKVMTFATLALEAFGPFLLFFPFFTGPVRTGAVFAFISLHVGIWLTMYIGLFQWVSALCMVCFLPAWFWDNLQTRSGSSLPEAPRIVLRLRGVTDRAIDLYRLALRSRWMSKFNLVDRSTASFALQGDPGALKSDPERATAPSDSSDFQVEQANRSPAGMSAGSGVQNRSVAKASDSVVLRSSLAVNLAASLFLAYIFCWNLTTASNFTMPERLTSVGLFLRLDQSWGMFSPYPSKYGGWYVIPGTLENGQRVDLLPVTRDDFGIHKLSWEKPRFAAVIYKNQHWRKYMENISSSDFAGQRLHFGRYICREWNDRHTKTEHLVSFDIVYMVEETLPDYKPDTVEKEILWRHSCA